MEPGGSMPHSQEFSNNSYPEPNQPNNKQASIRTIDTSEARFSLEDWDRLVM